MAEHWICLGEHSRASAKMLLGAYADGFEIGTTPDLVMLLGVSNFIWPYLTNLILIAQMLLKG